MGPGAGEHGGQVIASGPVEQIIATEQSFTGAYLSGRLSIPVPTRRCEGNGKSLFIKGAQANNLKNINIELPLGKFVVVTGVSGSGKSSLIIDSSIPNPSANAAFSLSKFSIYFNCKFY